MNQLEQKLLHKFQKSNHPEIMDRFQHSLNVAKKTLDIIDEHQFEVDKEKAYTAGLLHDYAKFVSMDEYFSIVKEFNLDNEILNNSFSVLHALLGPYIIKKELQIDDQEILDAVCYHTTGRANMGLLEEVVLLADFIEDMREEADKIRDIAKNDYKKAIALILDFKINKTVVKNHKLNNLTLTAFNQYRKYMNGELNKIKEILKAIDHNLVTNTKIYEMKRFTPLYDFVIITTALSQRQMEAAANYIKEGFDVRGIEAGDFWTLIDLNDVLIHVFLAEEREKYAIDRLLAHVPNIIL